MRPPEAFQSLIFLGAGLLRRQDGSCHFQPELVQFSSRLSLYRTHTTIVVAGSTARQNRFLRDASGHESVVSEISHFRHYPRIASLYAPQLPVISSKRHIDNRLRTGVHQFSVSQRAKEIPH